MGKVCALVNCRSNYKKQESKVRVLANKETVFHFPDKTKKPDLYRKWIRFVNRESWNPKSSVGICAKHFDPQLIKFGCRKTLKWELNPVPTDYCQDLPPSVIPTMETTRKPPVDRNIQEDEMHDFKLNDEISNFTDITDDLCPPEYKLERHDRAAIFYKLEFKDAPEVTETIIIDDKLHVRLFKKSIPIPLPQWFRKGNNCMLKRKSTFENFPAYIRNYGKAEKPDDIPKDILDELQKIRYKKTMDGPKFTPNLVRYALLLHYTSPQAYRMLLEQFPFPSITYLKKLGQGGVEPLKACQLLLKEGRMDKDVVFLLDEIYIQKDVQYDGGRLVGADEDGRLFKGIMTFMIVSLKKSIPFVVKAIPETQIEGDWLSREISSVLSSVHEAGFQVNTHIFYFVCIYIVSSSYCPPPHPPPFLLHSLPPHPSSPPLSAAGAAAALVAAGEVDTPIKQQQNKFPLLHFMHFHSYPPSFHSCSNNMVNIMRYDFRCVLL